MTNANMPVIAVYILASHEEIATCVNHEVLKFIQLACGEINC